jgi:hypothetical protein
MEATQEIYGVRNDLLLCGTKEAALQGADILAKAIMKAGSVGLTSEYTKEGDLKDLQSL